MFSIYKYFKNSTGKLSGHRWFTTLITINVLLCSFYLLVHFCGDRYLTSLGNFRIEFLSPEQKDIMNRILDSPADSLKIERADSTRKQSLKKYLRMSFLDMKNSDFVALSSGIIDSLSISELKIVLPKYPFKLRSYFWLYQNWIYFEIVLWCLFGVLANLLYQTADALRRKAFNKSEIYVQTAKLFYSPFCVIIIYICYNKIQSSDKQYDIQYSVYSIAVSFLLGFFSGRMIDLLNRLKDTLLPSGKGSSDSEGDSKETVEVPPEIILEAIKKKGDAWRNLYPNVIGISLEKKYTSGEQTDQYAILFEVSKKEASIKEGMIPPTINYVTDNNITFEIPTDVREVGKISAHAGMPTKTAQPGLSVGRVNSSSYGTIGLILQRFENNRMENYLLSCYHVLFSDELANGIFSCSEGSPIANSAIKQPADSEGENPIDKIGDAVMGILDTQNDFAVAKIDANVPILKNIFSLNVTPRTLRSIHSVDDNQLLVKLYGSKSGAKKGKIKSSYSECEVDFGNNQKVTLKGLIKTEKISDHGDSGTVVISDDNNSIVGLLISGSATDDYSYILPIYDFMSNSSFSL